MSAPRPDDPPPFDEGEYAILRVPDAWHVLSLAFFVAALGARFLVAFLPSGRGIFYRPILTAFSVPVLAAIGLLFGLVGLRRPDTRSVARIAVLLNLIVLGLSALAIAALHPAWLKVSLKGRARPTATFSSVARSPQSI